MSLLKNLKTSPPFLIVSTKKIKLPCLTKFREEQNYYKKKTSEELVNVIKLRYIHQEYPDVAFTKFLNIKQIPSMFVQGFYDRASDLSLKTLVIDGIAKTVVQKSRNAMFHSMLLGNLAREIRKSVISKDPKTPEEILTYVLLEENVCRSVNPFHTFENVDSTPNIPCAAT